MSASSGTKVVDTFDLSRLDSLADKKPTQKVWTDEEESILRNYWGKGAITSREIAKVLNRTVSSVKCKANRIGLVIEE